MTIMKWSEVNIQTSSGEQKGIAPEIISASRSTDIPAFHAEWLMHRLEQHYVKWINPFNQSPQYISFEKAKFVVFWSKNPAPLMKYLREMEKYRFGYYFQFTLNDYEDEKFERCVPPLENRIATFKALSEQIGKDRVLWRFDPLILTPALGVDDLLAKIKRVGDRIAPFTRKLVFSFADIACYKKVGNNLNRKQLQCAEFSKEQMVEAAGRIAALCKDWGIKAATCGESVNLSRFGIEHNKCIDDELILKISGNDPALRHLLGADLYDQQDMFASPNKKRTKKIKDPGQREACGCVFSKDIGQYNTCPHMCAYCYANTSENVVKRNAALVSSTSETIIADGDADPMEK
jgi:DNA repair photolyase